MHRESQIGLGITVIGDGVGMGLGLTGTLDPMWGWLIVGVSTVSGIYLIGRGTGKADEAKHAIRNPRKRFTMSDEMVIANLKNYMESKHKVHIDSWGIEAEYHDGFTSEEISKNKCSICQIPRNKQGVITDNE